MSDEPSCLLLAHSSSLNVVVILLPADGAYLRIFRLRVEEDEAADAGLRDHSEAFCKFDAEAESAGKYLSDILLEGVVRAT